MPIGRRIRTRQSVAHRAERRGRRPVPIPVPSARRAGAAAEPAPAIIRFARRVHFVQQIIKTIHPSSAFHPGAGGGCSRRRRLIGRRRGISEGVYLSRAALDEPRVKAKAPPRIVGKRAAAEAAEPASQWKGPPQIFLLPLLPRPSWPASRRLDGATTAEAGPAAAARAPGSWPGALPDASVVDDHRVDAIFEYYKPQMEAAADREAKKAIKDQVKNEINQILTAEQAAELEASSSPTPPGSVCFACCGTLFRHMLRRGCPSSE